MCVCVASYSFRVVVFGLVFPLALYRRHPRGRYVVMILTPLQGQKAIPPDVQAIPQEGRIHSKLRNLAPNVEDSCRDQDESSGADRARVRSGLR